MKIETTYTSEDGVVFAFQKECELWEDTYKKARKIVKDKCDWEFDQDDLIEFLAELVRDKIIKIL